MRIKLLSTGHNHSLALSDRGRLYSWGEGSDGQLGLGDMMANEGAERAQRGDVVQSTPQEYNLPRSLKASEWLCPVLRSLILMLLKNPTH